MNCSNCGEEVKQGQTFCTNCGGTIEQTELSSQQGFENKKSFLFFQTRKSKILAMVVVIVLVAGFVGYKALQALNKPEKVVEQFEKAVKTKDARELANLLNSGQKDMDVKESDAKMFLHYLEENKDLLAETKNSLRKEAQLFENENIISPKSDGLITLVESGKRWGIINQYGISFQPLYIKVTSNRDKTSLLINDKENGELKANDEKTVGPLLPMEYEVKGTYEATYTTVEDSKMIDSIEEDSYKIPVELDLTGATVSLYSNYDNAVVFINGKSTGKTVSELKKIGPVSTDGSLKIYAEVKVDGKTLKSGTSSVMEDGEEIDLSIDDTVIQEAKARQAEAEATAREAKEEAIMEIENVINSHYYHISYDEYSSAFDLFSENRKSELNYSEWEEGLYDNESNEVKRVVVDSVNGDNAVASFEMVSRDNKDDGILVQTFRGKWKLVKEFSGWKLDKSEGIKKVESRKE